MTYFRHRRLEDGRNNKMGTRVNKFLCCRNIHDGTNAEHQIRILLCVCQQLSEHLKSVSSTVCKFKYPNTTLVSSIHHRRCYRDVCMKENRDHAGRTEALLYFTFRKFCHCVLVIVTPFRRHLPASVFRLHPL